MKIVVTGSKGQLASEIINMIKSGKSEIGKIDPIYKNCDLVCVDVGELDITQKKQWKISF